MAIFCKTNEIVTKYIVYGNSFAKIEYPNTTGKYVLPKGSWPLKTAFKDISMGGWAFQSSMLSHKELIKYMEYLECSY